MTEDNALEMNLDSSSENEEDRIPKSRVTEMMKASKERGRELGRESMRDEYERVRQENERLKSSLTSPSASLDENFISRKIQEELEARQAAQEENRFKEEVQRTTNEFISKLQNGNELYSDFDEVVSEFNPSAYPALVWLANNTDNTAAIVYELAKNPQKLAAMTVIAERDPKGAQVALKKLSASIKSNQEAAALEKRSPQAPLSKMQSSPVGSNAGDLSIADFMKMYS